MASSSSSAPVPKEGRKYRFYRSDFGPLEVKPLHLDLTFDILESRVQVTTQTTFIYLPSGDKKELKEVVLSSKDLSIVSVARVNKHSSLEEINGKPSDFVKHVASFDGETSLTNSVDKEESQLKIQLDKPVKANEQFVLKTVTIATPTSHILEGLYFDYTPSGQPKTIITQCQQYGFERIVPCIDTMTAKAFYTTRIIADTRYTNVITNGDLAPGYFDPKTHNPIYHDDKTGTSGDVKRHEVKYHNHSVPMAPYLFFLGAGSYVTYKKELEYPNGHTFEIQLLVFPALVDQKHALTAIKSLHDSILWVHISCGPEAYDHPVEQKKIYELIGEREQLKESKSNEKRLGEVRTELKQLIGKWKTTGHTYTGQFYREIAMQNSDYGGMENVGNTTIVSSRLVPSDLVTDQAYLYMEAVKVHEFYHDINGSKVTGQSPFEIWLNEAVTVHIERMRSANLFGDDFNRLREIIYAFIPGQGPLANDRSPNALAVEPEGFNRTQELISGMTYFKAPEFVRMVELVMGKDKFMKGLDYYYEKFAWSNATTEEWIEAMEKVSGLSLKPMRAKWLQRTGYPDVTYKTSYDASAHTYKVSMKQTGFSNGTPYEIPVSWALVKGGKNMLEGLYMFKEAEAELVIKDVKDKPDFLSFAREWSFYGTSKNESASNQELVLQARTDPDTVNRYIAYRQLADNEKAAVIKNLIAGKKDYTLGREFVELHASILFDDSLTPSSRALILKEAEDISTFPELGHHYQAIADAKDALLQCVYDAHAEQILSSYKKLQSINKAGPHKDQLHERSLKHHLFNLIAAGNAKPTILSTRQASSTKGDVSALAKELIESPFMSDKLFGFAQYLQGPASAAEKNQVKSEVRRRFSSHPDSIEAYITILAGLDSDLAPTYIRELLSDEIFDINLSGHQRGITRGWSMIRKRSLLTQEGRDLLVELFIKIGKTNQYSAQPLIHAFSDLSKFDGEVRKQLNATLEKMKAGIDSVQQQSLYNQLNTLLASK